MDWVEVKASRSTASTALLAAFVLGISPVHAQTLRLDYWVPNGAVTAMTVQDDILYIGGGFTYIGPPTGGGAPIDAVTGSPTAVPHVSGRVNAAAPDGSGGWYIGGEFSSVDGQPRSNLAHILADGSVTAWNPGANVRVTELAVHGSTVFVAGDFTSIGGFATSRLAAIDGLSGVSTGWYPQPSNTVSDIALTDSVLYVCGTFTFIAGQTRNHIAAFDITTGLLTPWNPNVNGDVNAIDVKGSLIYAGGSFTGVGPRARNNLAAIDATTGLATNWNPDPNGAVNVVAVDSTTVFVAGGFSRIGGQAKISPAALDAANGTLTPWAPSVSSISNMVVSGPIIYVNGSFSTVEGQPRRGLAAVDKITGAPTGWNPDPNVSSTGALAVDGSTVFVGGGFSSVGGVRRTSLAAIDTKTGRATPWTTTLTGVIHSLASMGNLFVGTSSSFVSVNPVNGASHYSIPASGGVNAIAINGLSAYVGGGFTHLGVPFLPYLGTIDVISGAVNNAAESFPNNSVSALQIDGDRVYIAGAFQYFGPGFRSHIASFSISGTVDSWNPEAVGAVSELAVSDATVYAGGSFTAIGGDYRNSLAALDSETGTALPWNPNPNGGVTALAIGGSTLYVGGGFTSIAGQARASVAAFDLATGSLTDWNPNVGGSSPSIAGFARVGNTVFLGGGFASIGGYAHPYLAAFENPVASVPQPFERSLDFVAGPNPTRGSVRVQFALPQSESVKLSVYDLQGREVARLADGFLPAGPNVAVWDPDRAFLRAENGVYFLRLSAAGRTASRRLVLVR